MNTSFTAAPSPLQRSLSQQMGVCQNYGPFLGTLNIRCRIIIGIQKRDHNFDNHPMNWALGFLDPKALIRKA